MAAAEDPGHGNSTSLRNRRLGIRTVDLINSNIGVYNQNLNLIPSALKSLIGDEQTLFVITLENGGKMYALGTTENAEFVEFEKREELTDQEPH